MTVDPSIDSAWFLVEYLEHAEPDLFALDGHDVRRSLDGR